jgi:hypothetical protein
MSSPLHGFGLKLSPEYHQEILNQNPQIDWLEILTENYLGIGGVARHYLQQISERYPLVMHGVSMSLGSFDPLDSNYLHLLKQLAREIQAVHISDHLCFTGINHINSHDLLPLPYTEEMVKHVATRIRQVQDYLGQQILIENVSSYLEYKVSAMREWEFLVAVAKQADCLILADINNIYVSATNHGFDPLTYLGALPAARVAQIHLAGHSINDIGLRLDTHDSPVNAEVWQLYQTAIQLWGMRPTMIERDTNLPPLATLVAELNYARELCHV